MARGSTFGFPQPLIYGPSFPKIRMAMREGSQVFESRTNQNLFITEGHLTGAGTFTMAQFLRTLPTCKDCGRDRRRSQHYCPLVIKDVAWRGDTPTTFALKEEPDFSACPGIELLLGYCESDAQKRFLVSYCLALYTRDFGLAFTLADGDEWIEKAWAKNRLLETTERLALDGQLGFPALIPEVWLNAIGADRTPEDEEHLEENPQRVDFVLFPDWRRYVIEIDGPSHYARYDEALRRYEVSEERYTRNLRIERSLRRQGWEIFRFSNYEVNNSNVDDFKKLISNVPGATSTMIDRQRLRSELKPFDPSVDDLPL